MLLESNLRVPLMIPLTHLGLHLFLAWLCYGGITWLRCVQAAHMESVSQTAELGITVHKTKLMLCVWHSEYQNISRLNGSKFETKKKEEKSNLRLQIQKTKFYFLWSCYYPLRSFSLDSSVSCVHMHTCIQMNIHMYTHTYTKFLYVSSIKIATSVLLMWEDHETDKIKITFCCRKTLA